MVRWARVDALDPDFTPHWLNRAQLARRDRLRQPNDRRHFIGVRLLLRNSVAESLGGSPSNVELHQHCDRCGGAHGHPTVSVADQPGPQVSMAHAGGVVVVAVASKPVGVDLEPIGRRTDDLTRWVRTEAVLKATGHGLDVDPLLVGISDSDAAPELTWWRGPGRRPTLRLADIDLGDGFVAGVARLGRRRLDVDVAPRTVAVEPDERVSSEPVG